MEMYRISEYATTGGDVSIPDIDKLQASAQLQFVRNRVVLRADQTIDGERWATVMSLHRDDFVDFVRDAFAMLSPSECDRVAG